MTKSFEEKIKTTGVTEFSCLLEIARQLKRIGDLMEEKNNK